MPFLTPLALPASDPTGSAVAFRVDFTTHATVTMSSDTGYTITGEDGDGAAVAATWTLTGSANATTVALDANGWTGTDIINDSPIQLAVTLSDLFTYTTNDRLTFLFRIDDALAATLQRYKVNMNNSGNTYATLLERYQLGATKQVRTRRRNASSNGSYYADTVSGATTCIALEFRQSSGFGLYYGTWTGDYPNLSDLTEVDPIGFDLPGNVADPWTPATDGLQIVLQGPSTWASASFEEIVILKQAGP